MAATPDPRGAGSGPPALRPATLKDVAAVAGVSFKTAARAINDEPGIAGATRARVLEAAASLNFRKNRIAGGMRRHDRRTGSIGLIVDDAANTFFSALIRGIEDNTRSRDHLLLAGSTDRRSDREAALAQEFIARQIDGIIVAPCTDTVTFTDQARAVGIPVVVVDGLTDEPGVDSVISDNVQGMRRAVDHLAATGHRRIAYLGETTAVPSSRERFAGFSAAMAAHAFTVDPRLLAPTVLHPAESDSALSLMLDGSRGPSAVIAGNNSVAVGAMSALHRAGREHDVALISFDDLPLAAYTSPGLTAVVQDTETLARTACDRLFSRLEGDDSPGRVFRIPVTLTARGSGEIPAPRRRARSSA